MNVRLLVSTFVAVTACGGEKHQSSGGSGSATATSNGEPRASAYGSADRYLKAAWKTTEVEVGDVKVKVDVPDGLPANDEYLLGTDWWVGTNADIQKGFPAGPRLTLDKPKEKTFDAETLARDVEPDAARSDLVELAKEKLADGRVRYVSAVNGGSHIDVTVWIPLADPARGIKCTAHWWAGIRDTEPKVPPPADPAIVDWLKKFCDSVQPVQ